jgi:hypothetical protein
MAVSEIVVCPKCGYGFHMDGSPEVFCCPRKECAFSRQY